MHLLKRIEGITMKIFTNYFIYLFYLEAKGYLWSIPRIKKNGFWGNEVFYFTIL